MTTTSALSVTRRRARTKSAVSIAATAVPTYRPATGTRCAGFTLMRSATSAPVARTSGGSAKSAKPTGAPMIRTLMRRTMSTSALSAAPNRDPWRSFGYISKSPDRRIYVTVQVAFISNPDVLPNTRPVKSALT